MEIAILLTIYITSMIVCYFSNRKLYRLNKHNGIIWFVWFIPFFNTIFAVMMCISLLDNLNIDITQYFKDKWK